MKVRVKVNWTEVWEINPESLPELEEARAIYHPEKDEKWIAFCKKHHFHPLKDAYGKIYDLYLRMCGAELI